MKMYNCLNCGVESKWSHQKTNKYCSVTCSTEHKQKLHKEGFWAGTLEKRIDRPIAKRYIVEANGYSCSICGISDYNGKLLSLELDHIDGNAGNNLPDNLRLLCPNCHSQQDNYGAKNKGNGRKARGLPLY